MLPAVSLKRTVPLPFSAAGKENGLDLNDGAEESGDAESEHSADGRCIGGLLSAELMEAAHLCDLIDISSCHLERRCFVHVNILYMIAVGDFAEKFRLGSHVIIRRVLRDCFT